MIPPAPQTLEIRHDSDVAAARRSAKDTAASIGFAPDGCEEIALVVSELGTNLVKHARSGQLILTFLAAGERVGLQIESLDQGPGMANINESLADGFSTASSLGIGLGTVNRLMDELDITSRLGSGTRLVCRKWIRAYGSSLRPCPLTFGVATRSHPQYDLNGDAFVIKRWAEHALVGVIDGLGHGPLAHRAAQAARHYVETHFDQPLQEIFRGVGRACRSTRGVVMALARFDWAASEMVFASVGNIEARVMKGDGPFSFIVRRGIIGVNAPPPVLTTHRWAPDNILALHSDGLSTRWGSDVFKGLADKPADVIAGELLRALAKPEDDATVLVVTRSTA